MPAPALLSTGLPPALRALVEQFQQRRTRTTADRSLAHRLRDGLRRGDGDVSGLAFYVHDGAVSVYGTVASEAEREAVLAVVAGQPGVRRIVDHLTIGEGVAASGSHTLPPAWQSPYAPETTSPRPAVASTKALTRLFTWERRTASVSSEPAGE